jgi:hypothetical protein
MPITLTINPTKLHIAFEPPTTIQSIEISPATVPDRSDEQHSIDHHNQQDPSATLVSHSGDQQHSQATEKTHAPDELQSQLTFPNRCGESALSWDESIVARAELDRLQSELNSTRAHGDTRRFRVSDDTHGYTRQISEFDIRRRADANASVALRQVQDLDTGRRQQLRHSRYDCEIERHSKGIGDHQLIVSKTIHKLEGQLAAAQKEHAQYRPHVQQIQLRYQAQQSSAASSPLETQRTE